MKQKVLILCDREEDYAQQMAAFLEKGDDFPLGVVVCTGKNEFEQSMEKYCAEILLLSESMSGELLPGCPANQVVLLNESGYVCFPEIKNVDKYQPAENVRKELLQFLADRQDNVYPMLPKNREVKIIGFYSPVRRCLQTSLAIAYGQLLAEQGKVLYLTFEYYSSHPGLSAEDAGPDLGALIYQLDSEEEKFALYLKMLLRSVGNWDYIAPMRNGANLPSIEAAEWQNLINRCSTLGEYDYIVLDLNDSMQGLFDILHQCNQIYTIVKEDSCSLEKARKYEYLLTMSGYGDVQEKTVKLNMPSFGRLPVLLEDYSRGELAEYVQKIMLQEERYGV